MSAHLVFLRQAAWAPFSTFTQQFILSYTCCAVFGLEHSVNECQDCTLVNVNKMLFESIYILCLPQNMAEHVHLLSGGAEELAVGHNVAVSSYYSSHKLHETVHSCTQHFCDTHTILTIFRYLL